MGQKRVLVVEDETDISELIRYNLEKAGYAVATARSGEHALESARANPPDLVLLDLMLPDMSGWDVYQQMKADAAMRNIPIVVVTARARDVDKLSDIHLAGIGDYITKPFKSEVLLQSVHRVLGEE